MRLFLFADLHTNLAIANELVAKSHAADVVIGAGDFATMHEGLQETIDVLSAIDKPAVIIPGNNETEVELRAACTGWASVTILHGSGTEIDGVSFYGLGCGIPRTPFGEWSFDLSDDEAAPMLEGCPTGAVLISHSPPKGALDLTSGGESKGSTAVRDAIVRTAPRLVVCGHIHAAAGQEAMIGPTCVINPGPKGMIVEVEGDRGAEKREG